MNVLITGISGFVGKHLSSMLMLDKNKISGIDIIDFTDTSLIDFKNIDLLDFDTLHSYIAEKKFDKIFHLAAFSNPAMSNIDPQKALNYNIIGTTNLLEAVRLTGLETKCLLVGTQLSYKKRENGFLNENDILNPESIYAASKVALEFIGNVYKDSYGIQVFFTRSFNHTGPGQTDLYVLSNFAKQCVEIKLGLREPILFTGNLEIERDFMDVRDVCSAYNLILDNGKPGEIYNVCSGKAFKLYDIIQQMLLYLKIENVEWKIESSRLNKNDILKVAGNNSKLKNHTGWKQKIPLEKTIHDLIDYWMHILKDKKKG